MKKEVIVEILGWRFNNSGPDQPGVSASFGLIEFEGMDVFGEFVLPMPPALVEGWSDQKFFDTLADRFVVQLYLSDWSVSYDHIDDQAAVFVSIYSGQVLSFEHTGGEMRNLRLVESEEVEQSRPINITGGYVPSLDEITAAADEILNSVPAVNEYHLSPEDLEDFFEMDDVADVADDYTYFR